ncbi:MAG TPA: DNA translocase FtsK 4TM domain-containing protein [Anaerolineae bacterium]|nr:DNA translocase FtsK 4TM domain-containing protein [Anaerolineae bacterium]
MKRKGTKRKSVRKAASRATTAPKSSPGIWRWLLHREVWGLSLVTIGGLTIISLVWRGEGKLSQAWALGLRQMFGVGAYAIGLLFVGCGAAVLFWHTLRRRVISRWQTIIGCEVAFFVALGLVHILASEPPLEFARSGKGGGYVGWLLWRVTVPLLGKPASALLLLALGVAGVCLATGVSWRSFSWRLLWLLAKLGKRLRASVAARQAVEADAGLDSVAALSTARRQSAQAGLEAGPAPFFSDTGGRRTDSTRREGQERIRTPSRSPGLPPVDLLAPDEADGGDDADARLRAQIIGETLGAFGVPAQVIGWHRGPVVTQFDVEPGYVERQDRDGNLRRYKVRVSKIQALANDLALALAAVPIRIEAPVPGRPVVGIEVPNEAKSLVGLRGVLQSNAFRKMSARLRIALGRDVSGGAVVADLSAMPHLLVAGATGSGKSVCLNAVIASLLFFSTPDQLRLLLIDPKRVELTRYNGIPHLLAPVVVDVERVVPALRWVTREMDRRYACFARAGARSLSGYNRIARSTDLDPMPVIVIVIDELADIMLMAPDEAERTLCRIAQMSRATGIHLIIATQRPSTDVVTGLIKANFPARISFAVASQVDSRVILDSQGAEKLLGRGDMLFMAPDSAKLTRAQGCFVSDKEIESLAAFWRRTTVKGGTEAEESPPWEAASGDESDFSDSLLERAVELVRKHERASASFLQRQMRIGYPRAARIIDQLEKRGIVGPPEAGGRSRVVLDRAPSEGGNEESSSEDRQA